MQQKDWHSLKVTLMFTTIVRWLIGSVGQSSETTKTCRSFNQANFLYNYSTLD